ncbi:MAG: cysteine synthase A [Bacillota bacterium]
MINDSILDVIGLTPVIRLNRVTDGCPANILAKLEMLNPTGSAKARSAWGMIQAAERSGVLKPGGLIVEPTSGNQGIALAMVGAVRGYRVMLVMPEKMSIERKKLMEAFGAEVVLTPAAEDLSGAVRKARELASTIPGAWMPDQFSNPTNPDYHERTTAQEIMSQVDEPISAFLAGVGTGGTLTGVARVLKKHYPGVLIYAIEPAGSAVLSGGPPGEHGIQGIGDGFIPGNLDLSLLDGAVPVSDKDACNMARRLAREEGILAGVSSGAAVVAAVTVGRQIGGGATVLTILPDTGERYLSTSLFEKDDNL